MKSGDIVLIRFPQTDLTHGKLRPALVVATTPGRHKDLLLALISSRTHQAIPKFDEIIQSSDTDFPTTGLKITSIVRLARLVTVETAIINARLGRISSQRLEQIKKRLTRWLQK